MTETHTEKHEYEGKKIDPVPVCIVDDNTPEKIRSATYSAWSSYQFAGTENVPVKLLPYDERRRRAVIQGLPGFKTNNTLGNMWIGSRAQVGNGNPAGAGAILVSGQSVTVESASELFCVPDGTHELSVTVLDEIYRT